MTLQFAEVDRSDDRPPYRQIAGMLRSAIQSGELGPGEKLPSEAELIEHFKVARMTARQAIQELRSEGLVIAEHGRGVFVRPMPPVRRLASDRFARKHRDEGKAAFYAEADKAGYSPSVDRITVGHAPADPHVAERYTTGGTPVAEFRVLVSHRVKNSDDQWIEAEPTGHNVKVYGRLAEATVDQLTNGSHVIVIGRTETDAWPEPTTGEKRTTTRVIVDRHGTVGLALHTASNTIDRSADHVDQADHVESDNDDQ